MSWKRVKCLVPTGIRIVDRPVRSLVTISTTLPLLLVDSRVVLKYDLQKFSVRVDNCKLC
jgi:hypothetical protein